MKEVEIRCYWISQKSIITGIWGLGWGAGGKKTLPLNTVGEDIPVIWALEEVLGFWKVEKIVVDKECIVPLCC